MKRSDFVFEKVFEEVSYSKVELFDAFMNNYSVSFFGGLVCLGFLFMVLSFVWLSEELLFLGLGIVISCVGFAIFMAWFSSKKSYFVERYVKVKK